MKAALFRFGLLLSLLALAFTHRARLAWRRLTQGPIERCVFCGEHRRRAEMRPLGASATVRVCETHGGLIDGGK